MERMRRFLAIVAAILALTALQAGHKEAGAAPGEDGGGKGIVYLIRGGLNIFSTGMDEIAVKLRARGVDARTLGQASWREAAREAVQRYEASPQPIVFVGHSFGANAATLAAEQIGRSGMRVALIVLFDPTDKLKAPWNADKIINFVSVDSLGNNVDVWAGPGFAGSLENILHTEVNHIQIDNDAKIQDQAVDEIAKTVGAGRRASAR